MTAASLCPERRSGPFSMMYRRVSPSATTSTSGLPVVRHQAAMSGSIAGKASVDYLDPVSDRRVL